MAEETLIGYLSSDNFLQASSNATRLVTKLKSAIQRRELYETHQILRTIYFRFLNVKEKVIALESLLYHGSCYLLELNELTSGQDIATLFLETAAKCLRYHRDGNEEAKSDLVNASLNDHISKKTLDWQLSEKVAELAARMPETEIGKPKFVAESCKILDHKLLNTCLLHQVMAQKFWAHKDFVNCRYHYLHCASIENAPDIAKFLVQYHTSSASISELDLFITQFILQFLCLQTPLDPPKNPNNQRNNNSAAINQSHSSINRKTRNAIKRIVEIIFSSYTLKHPLLADVSAPFSSSPLLNFTHFIISIIDADKEASIFRTLCNIYQVTWTRDPNYKGYLDRIGTLYFGIVDQSKQRQDGFFNNILLSLLDGADEEEEDSDHDGNNLSSCDDLD